VTGRLQKHSIATLRTTNRVGRGAGSGARACVERTPLTPDGFICVATSLELHSGTREGQSIPSAASVAHRFLSFVVKLSTLHKYLLHAQRFPHFLQHLQPCLRSILAQSGPF
jgi:hypothetical protein